MIENVVINYAKKDTTKDCTNWENFKLGERCEFKHISDPDNKYKSQIIYLKKTVKDFSHTRLICEKKKNLDKFLEGWTCRFRWKNKQPRKKSYCWTTWKNSNIKSKQELDNIRMTTLPKDQESEQRN